MVSRTPNDSEQRIAHEAASASDRRRDPRRAIGSILMPFLGTRETDQGAFEYLLTDISQSGVGLSIPKWLVSREHLKPDDRINLHLPFSHNKRFYTRGQVAWTRWDDQQEAQLCGLRMERSIRPYYHVYISIESGGFEIDLQDFETVENLLQSLLKDAYLLKRGVLIYLKHLVPFFYRIAAYPTHDYPELKETLLDDIRQHVARHARQLNDLYDTAVAERWAQKEIPRLLDLEQLRELMESDVQRDLLMTVFGGGSVAPYLNAIYELEKKQSHLFNTIVMLYLQELAESISD